MTAAAGAPEKEPGRSIELLIIELGTRSDVLRSLMALKAVKQLYPATRIRLLADRAASEPATRVEWIEEILSLPEGLSRENALPRVARFLDGILDRRFDLLANWTSAPSRTRLSAIATSLIPSLVKLGDHFREDGTVGSFDAWSMYRHAWVEGGVEQDIHRTDLITTQLLTALQIHAGEPAPEAGTQQVTSRYFFKIPNLNLPETWTSRPHGLKWIAIPVENAPERISEWMDRVLRRHPDYGMVILGGETLEVPDSPRVICLKDPGFDATVTVLGQCSWMMAGPSPLVDLASLVNLRIFYSPEPEAREFGLKWSETGPYGNGHVVFRSGQEWEPEAAYAAWSYYQSEWFHKNSITLQGHFEQLGVESALQRAQIFKSRIRPSNEGGGVCYDLTAGITQEFESWIYRVRGQMARAWFCGWLPEIHDEAKRLALSPALVKRIRGLEDSVKVVDRIVNEARMTAIRLEDIATRNRSTHLMSVEDREGIEDCGRKLLEMESLIGRVTRVEPELQGLLLWYRQRVHNLESPTLAGMAKETVQALDLVVEGLDLLIAWTGKTLELARPRAVETAPVEKRNQGLEN